MSKTEVKYPDLIVQLTGEDGNAFAIMGAVTREMKQFGVSREEIGKFREEAMSGDYDNLLRTCMEWVTVE